MLVGRCSGPARPQTTRKLKKSTASDRSAKWRACPERSRMGTCCSSASCRNAHGSDTLPFVIPSVDGPFGHASVMKNSFCLATALQGSVALPFVIQRGCDFCGMTISLGHSHTLPKYELSSRPERSEVDLRLTHPASNANWNRPLPLCHPERNRRSHSTSLRAGNPGALRSG